MNFFKTCLLSLLLLTLSIQMLSAMTPEIKMPQWCKTEVSLTEWNPETSMFIISVEIAADKIDMSQVTSKASFQKWPNLKVREHEREFLKKGERSMFSHKIHAKAPFETWVDFDIRALPDIKQLLALIEVENKNNATKRGILTRDAQRIDKPVYIGLSIPLCVREDLAMAVTSDLLPALVKEKDAPLYYTWNPKDFKINSPIASSLKIFEKAMKTQNPESLRIALLGIEQACDKHAEDFVVLQLIDGTDIALPKQMLLEFAKLNSATQAALKAKNPARLIEFTDTLPADSFVKPFAHFNLAGIFNQKASFESAAKNYKIAISKQPTWPLAKELYEKNLQLLAENQEKTD